MENSWGFANETYFKVYMSDVGMLRTRSKLTANTILEENMCEENRTISLPLYMAWNIDRYL